MQFETPTDVLSWYTSQTRVLTPEFLETIPWKEVKNQQVEKQFFPVLCYMRDVEKFTEIYYNELMRTPSGKDNTIAHFLEKWSHEEALHAELLNRFLGEAGFPTDTEGKWYEKAKEQIPKSYRIKQLINPLLLNCMGRTFIPVHMTWGAINELSTLTGYQRLWALAKHPVLEYLLRAIAREEATHSFLYWSVAKLTLKDSHIARQTTRFIIKHFWTPVGQGLKRAKDTRMVVRALFREGKEVIDRQVNDRIAQLPGMQLLDTVSRRIASVFEAEKPQAGASYEYSHAEHSI